MQDNTEILSAFALCDSNSGANAVEWKDCSGKALYIDRLGVKYLRLFVVDINTPAIQLYTKNGLSICIAGLAGNR